MWLWLIYSITSPLWVWLAKWQSTSNFAIHVTNDTSSWVKSFLMCRKQPSAMSKSSSNVRPLKIGWGAFSKNFVNGKSLAIFSTLACYKTTNTLEQPTGIGFLLFYTDALQWYLKNACLSVINLINNQYELWICEYKHLDNQHTSYKNMKCKKEIKRTGPLDGLTWLKNASHRERTCVTKEQMQHM